MAASKKQCTLKGNATVKHVKTDVVKNHIFALVTPKWPLT